MVMLLAEEGRVRGSINVREKDFFLVVLHLDRQTLKSFFHKG
jgi:hypothetical protein